MKGNHLTVTNDSTVYFAEASDLEQPFDKIAHEINNVFAADLPDLPYVISGSSLLRMFLSHAMGESPDFAASDVDVYAKSPEEYSNLVSRFSTGDGVRYESHSDRDVKFSYGDRVYDFVCFKYGTVLEIVTRHDLSACGIGAAVDDGRAQVLAVTQEFIATMNDGRMRAQKDFENTDPVSTARTIDRMFRYKARGFDPTFELLNDMAKHIYSCDPDEINDVAAAVADAPKSDDSG